MDPSRLKSRKLVTYGSSKRNQGSLQTTSARSSVAKGSQDRSTTIRPSRSSTNEALGSEHRQKQSGHQETPPASKSAGPVRTAEEDSIYDLPSSDEEDQELAMRRKRRRYGADNKEGVASLRNAPSVENTSDQGAKDGSHDLSATSNTATSPRKGNPLRAINPTPGRARSQRLDQGARSTPKKFAEEASATAPWETESTPVDFREKSEPPSQSKGKLISRESQSSSPTMEPRSPISRILKSTMSGNATPTRKRLIDTLGTPERSLDSSSSIAAISQASSPCTPRSPDRPSTLPLPQRPAHASSQATDLGQESAAAVSPHVTGSRVTYARQRSFLDDLSAMVGDVSGPNLPAGLETGGLSTSQPRRIDDLPRAPLFEIEEVNNEDGSVRSIHELRRAGGNARYRGAIESIFEDIEDPQISVSGRCNSFVQLCDRLLDSKSARQFAECNFDKRLIDCLSRNLDMVSSAFALCAFALSSRGRSLPYVLAVAAWPKLLDVSPILLGAQSDVCAIVRARDSGISKAAQRSLQNITPRIKAALFPGISAPTFSPRLVALYCLKLTISVFQSKGEIPDKLPGPVLNQVVNLLLSASSHVDEMGATNAEELQVLNLGLLLLEAHSMTGDSAQQDQRNDLGVLSELHGLLRLEDGAGAARQQVQILYLRVLLNTTNSDPALCDQFATAAMIEELAAIAVARFGNVTEDILTQENNPLDTVILALGALINLVEQSEASRAMFLRSEPDRGCILDRLLRIFLAHVDSISRAHSVVEVHHNVAVGYLAVLLLALCLHPDARIRIKESLRPQGLTTIISTVNEFLQYHQKIEQEMHSAPAKKEASGFLVRLRDLVSEIQRIDE